MTDDMHSCDGWVSRPSPKRAAPDRSNQAAILLAESILHALVEAGVLTLAQAISAVRTASEVQTASAEETDEPVDQMAQTLSVLSNIERSLTTDAGEDTA